MSRWLCVVYGLFWSAMCFGADDPSLDARYVFTVVAWYGEGNDHVSAKPLELTYKSMQECREAQERVHGFLSQSDEKDFGYIIIDCVRVRSAS
jgi:hypothetical protein